MITSDLNEISGDRGGHLRYEVRNKMRKFLGNAETNFIRVGVGDDLDGDGEALRTSFSALSSNISEIVSGTRRGGVLRGDDGDGESNTREANNVPVVGISQGRRHKLSFSVVRRRNTRTRADDGIDSSSLHSRDDFSAILILPVDGLMLIFGRAGPNAHDRGHTLPTHGEEGRTKQETDEPRRRHCLPQTLDTRINSLLAEDTTQIPSSITSNKREETLMSLKSIVRLEGNHCVSLLLQFIDCKLNSTLTSS